MTGPAPLAPATLAHAPVIAALHRCCFDEPWDAAAIRALLAAPGGFGLIACDEGDAEHGTPAAFILCRTAAGEAEVLAIGTAPACRRRGLARRILGAAMAECARRGAATLLLEVACDNRAAIALYEGEGFAAVGRRPRYYQTASRAVDAHIMSRRLAAPEAAD